MPIGDIVIGQHKAVGWEIIVFDLPGKLLHRAPHCVSCYHAVLHDLKSLRRKPLHLLFSGIVKINISGLHQCKCIESHVPLRCDLII